MSKLPNIQPFNPSKSVIDTVINGNNNFVSTLDHLPCEITRCLWFIQMMNLRNTRNEIKLKSEYNKPDNERNYKTIHQLRTLILRNSEELVEESNYLISFLSDHLETLDDDLSIIQTLKEKLPGWTSEAVERRWKEWGMFKLNYLSRVKDKEPNEFDKYVQNFAKKTTNKGSLRTTIPKPSSDLKIKINLKNITLKANVKKTDFSSITKHNKVIKPLPTLHLKSTTNSDNEKQLKIEIKQPSLEKPIEELYCFCNGPSFGKMVACEYDKCPHEWFHFKCVGLTNEPKGKWFCSDTCKDKYETAQLRKKQRKKRRW
ncbi:hypothetical protein CANINC_004505 [Pichia inconspicua]|uniref:Zinc finger PHD-type domain-containing protein n=1 Tax=Pichia inconspicua TaxID=52247 RepID=A0A4T0WVQ5_9ASCO|nr:hypothetical protein CANINC_004505 [[Candida] inconspicua]